MFKSKLTTLDVEHIDGDGSDGEPSKKVVPSILVAIMNMDVEQEPTML